MTNDPKQGPLSLVIRSLDIGASAACGWASSTMGRRTAVFAGFANEFRQRRRGAPFLSTKLGGFCRVWICEALIWQRLAS